jgi:uncharacterized phage protein gp47/JayE
MPADFSQYVDLTVYDKEPGDMYLEAIEMARLTLPEFNLRTGTVEDAIFQAISWIGWVNATAVNRIPDRLMAGILSMMGVTIQLSSPAQMGVVVTADSYEGTTIPVGTLFGYTSVFEDEVIEYIFMTVESLEIAAIESPEIGDPFPSGTVAAECMTPGVIPSIPEGTSLTILTPSTSIISAEASGDFQNGVNDENSSAFLSRASSYLSSLSSTLVKGTQVDSYVSNTYSALVSRVRTYDLTDGDPDTGDIATSKSYSDIDVAIRDSNIATIVFGTAVQNQIQSGDMVTVDISDSSFNGTFEVTGVTSSSISYANTGTDTGVSGVPVTGTVSKGQESLGNIAVFVYGNNDFLTTAQLLDVETAITEKVVPGLIVNVSNVQLLSIGVEASIVLDSNYDQEPLKQTIENSIIEYLSPSSYPLYEDVVRVNQVIAEVSAIPGVRYVSSMTLLPTTGNWLPQIDENLEPANKGWAPRIIPDNMTISYTVV